MLEHCRTHQELWGGVNRTLDGWFEARKQLLVEYSALCQRLDDMESPALKARLRRFCQSLMDYVSTGHFEVYEQLETESKRYQDKEALLLGSRLYKQLQSCTEVVLDFDQRYTQLDNLGSLARDLSKLGLCLEKRFFVEDSMVSVMHDAHREQAA
ncbi:sigma D regulator [uncultured Pseudoteredinibacter sp.]|uniref:sigma D regulator n=1 Tax=uncultured Pseudoteredinibacter sp. TaxID=1641701 RepID=UPI00261F09E6|nr:sigma D regulator [uncultured Pseudoteredinibacter sp.]MCV6622509.1 sigma D regulator [Cellvibrionaceae bacterium]